MELARRTWTAFREDPPDIGLVPVGSVEQHGPHAPLGTDLIIADAVAERGATASDLDVAVTPPVPVGIAAEHRQFEGTLWVEPNTFRQYVSEVVSSLAVHDVSGVVIVNGHGGNIAALDEVAAGLTRDGTCDTAAFTWFDSLSDPPEPMGHGGPLETAALLAIDPELVATDRIEAAAAAAADRWGEWVGRTNIAVDVDSFSENGVVGNPRAATAELGDALLDEAVDNLAAVAAAVADRNDQS